MKHWRKALIGLAVTALLLWWVLRGQDYGRIWAEVRSGDLALLAAAVALTTAGFAVRAMRWKVLLARIAPDTGFRSRFAAVAIHFMANNLLPARAGELARAYAFSRLEPVSAGAAFGSLVVERLLDGLVLLLFLILPVLLPDFPRSAALTEGLGGTLLKAAVIGVVLVLGVLIAMVARPRAFARLGRSMARLLPARWEERAVDALDHFLGAIEILREPRLMVLALLWSIGFWAFNAVTFWMAMVAFDIDTGFVSAVFTLAVIAFAVAIPSAPGFFGTFHAGAAFALTGVYGVEASRALAFAFGFHFGGWLPITLIGLWYAWRIGLSLGEVEAAEPPWDEEEGEGAHGSEPLGA